MSWHRATPRRAPADTGARQEDSPAAEAPVKTRETAGDGYRQALAAHRTVRPDRHVADPVIQEAIESQTRALRELSRRAFPDPGTEPSPIDAARAQRRRQVAATEAAALRRARTERATRQASTDATEPQPTELRTTA
ncbi:hypothetical protein [Streptomyces flaveolus]|uniref:hypothetical protein n=1 Tax=Streptomyces flaveolus TaxID=67297 RepID=UPI0038156EF1